MLNIRFVLVMLAACYVQNGQSFNIAQLVKDTTSGFNMVTNGNRLNTLQSELLSAVSNTGNGKQATIDQQAKVLSIVGELESLGKPSDELLTDFTGEACKLDGCWYLQYTSPSELEDGGKDQFPDAWKPSVTETPLITTKKFGQSGAVSAGGIKVDTNNRLVQQIIDVKNSRISNVICLDFGTVRVSGSIERSDVSPLRVIVSFDELKVKLDKLGGLELNFGIIFSLRSIARGTKQSGWLETTFLSEDVRIGRGNKGTMFILTRDQSSVLP